MKQGNRKVDEQARETIAGILLFDVSDPRLDLVTITGCKVSYDRAHCDAFYTVDPGRYESTAQALEASKGHIRSVMAKKLHWRKAPLLRFHLDETVDVAERMGRFLEQEKDRLSDTSAQEGGEGSDR